MTIADYRLQITFRTCSALLALLLAIPISTSAFANDLDNNLNNDLNNNLNNKPLNIVFILADNQAAIALPQYGNKDWRAPALSALANKGVTFNNAFAVSGMCSPTRATLMTGVIPSHHGIHNAFSDEWVDEREQGWSPLTNYYALPQQLSDAGYQTAMVGKWHIGDARTAQLGYQHWVALPYGHTKSFWNNKFNVNGELVDVSGRHVVDVMAEYASRYIEEAVVSGKEAASPFYLQLNLDGPYTLPPTNYGPAKNRHYTNYSDQTFQSMPITPVNDVVLSRINGPFIAEHAIENGIDDMSLDEIWNSILHRLVRMQGDRNSYANFLSQNHIVDDAVGRVIASLDSAGLLETTLIIYSADQGNLFGQHGSWGHTTMFYPSHLYDDALRIPLIIRHPNADIGRADHLVSQYDLPATIFELAGLNYSANEQSPGKSFARSVLDRDSEGPHQAVYFEQEESRGIRTEQYAYWKRLKGMGEPRLFDVRDDPGQLKDIYPEHRNSSLVKQLDNQLDNFFNAHARDEVNLWTGGVSVGTMPNPMPWIKKYPWPWIKKFISDI